MLTEAGILQPVVLTQITSFAAGNLVKAPPDGSFVTRGEELFLIDENDLTENIRQREENIGDAVSDLEIAEQEFEAAKQKSLATLARDRARLAYAQFEQSYKLIAIQPDDRRILDINIHLAELDLVDAEADYERMQNMIQQSFAAASQLEPLERKVGSARTYLQELKLNLAVREKGISEEERIALQAEVDQAQAGVERSQLLLEATLNTLRTGMDRQRASLKHLEEDLARLKEQLKHTTVRAPMDGVIRLRRKLRWSTGGWQTISTGTGIETKDILADLVSAHQMHIEIMVHESDVRSLTTGMPVRVDLTAYPGESFPGRLIMVSSLGQDRADLAAPGYEITPASQSVFRGIIEFDARDIHIQPGMSAQVHITVSPPQPQLILPREAVGYIDRVPHVRTRPKRDLTAIQGHMISPQKFAVTGGLDQDTQVLTPFIPPSGAKP